LGSESSVLNDKEINEINSWISGIIHEVTFWQYYLKDKKHKDTINNNDIHNGSAYGQVYLTDEQINSIFKETNNNTVLDVGCGMVYSNIAMYRSENIDFHFVDPLAFTYNLLAKKSKLNVPEIEFGFIEYLSMAYECDSTALIIINNALDHCFNPFAGVVQCLKVLKKYGVLYLCHVNNEAERNNYAGFHQFNICTENGCLVFWNKSEHINVTDMLRNIAAVDTYDHDGNCIAVIKKINPVDDCFIHDSNLLCRQLMYATLLLSYGNLNFTKYFKRIVLYISVRMNRGIARKVKALIKRVLRKT